MNSAATAVSRSPAATARPDYNGLKMVIGGETLALDAIQQTEARIEAGDLLTGRARSRADVARRLCREDRRRREAPARR